MHTDSPVFILNNQKSLFRQHLLTNTWSSTNNSLNLQISHVVYGIYCMFLWPSPVLSQVSIPILQVHITLAYFHPCNYLLTSLPHIPFIFIPYPIYITLVTTVLWSYWFQSLILTLNCSCLSNMITMTLLAFTYNILPLQTLTKQFTNVTNSLTSKVPLIL